MDIVSKPTLTDNKVKYVYLYYISRLLFGVSTFLQEKTRKVREPDKLPINKCYYGGTMDKRFHINFPAFKTFRVCNAKGNFFAQSLAGCVVFGISVDLRSSPS